MEQLSKEQLIQLLTLNKATLPEKKPRKKADLDAEKKQEMLERLERMRATVAENRKTKAGVPPPLDPVIAGRNSPHIEMTIFEKRYESKFDKMTELLSTLNDNTKAVADLKREKKEMKDKEKADKAAEDKQKQEAQSAMKKLQEEQLEIARTQQYTRDSASQQRVPEGVPRQQVQPSLVGGTTKVQPSLVGGTTNPLAKFTRPKPQLW